MKSERSTESNTLVVFGALVSLMTFGMTTVEQSTTESLSANTSQTGQIESQTTSALKIPTRLRDLNIPVEPFARNVAIAKWILELREEKISDWLAQSTDSSWDVSLNTRNQIQTLLVRRLAEISPHEAEAFALARVEPVRTRLLKVVFTELAIRDSSKAIENVKKMDLSAHQRLGLLLTIFELSDERTDDDEQKILQDFRDEQNLFSYTADSQKRENVVNAKDEWYQTLRLARSEPKAYEDLVPIAQAWIDETGVDSLDEIYDSISNYGVRKQVLKEALLHLATSQPKQAFDYTLLREFPDKNSTMIGIVRNWAKYGDAIDALNTVHALPYSQHRRTLENQIVKAWMGVDFSSHFSGTTDPIPLLDNLYKLPSSLRGDVSVIAMQNLVWVESPSKAVEELFKLDKDLQLNAARVLVEGWVRKDQESCIEWVLTNPQSKHLRNDLYHSLAWKLLDQDEPELAFQIGRKQPIPDHGVGLEGSLLADLASDDLATAIDLLPSVRDGKTMITAYASVGEELLLRGKPDDAIELGTELPTNERFQYFSRLTHTWAQNSPVGLVAAIERFPSAAIRSYVAMQQILWNSSTNYFTNEQVQVLEQHLQEKEKTILEEQR